MSLVLHHSKSKGTAKLVLLGIANHEGDGGAWPSVATLMRYAHADRRTVQRAIERLVDMGELQVLRQKGGNDMTHSGLRPNLYRVRVFCPHTCDGSAQHRLKHSALPGFEWVEPDPEVVNNVVSNFEARRKNAAPPAAPTPPKPSTNSITQLKKETVVIREAKVSLAPCPDRNGQPHEIDRIFGDCIWCGGSDVS